MEGESVAVAGRLGMIASRFTFCPRTLAATSRTTVALLPIVFILVLKVVLVPPELRFFKCFSNVQVLTVGRPSSEVRAGCL